MKETIIKSSFFIFYILIGYSVVKNSINIYTYKLTVTKYDMNAIVNEEIEPVAITFRSGFGERGTNYLGLRSCCFKGVAEEKKIAQFVKMITGAYSNNP